MKHALKTFLFLGIAVFFQFHFTAEASAVVNTWDGSSGDGLWSTDANWSTGAKPISSDTPTFDGTCGATCDVSIDIDVSVAAMNMASGYTGTITQSRAC